MPKKKNNWILGASILAILIGIGLLVGQGKLFSFTFEEQTPITSSQNGLEVTIKKAFLSGEPIVGTCDGGYHGNVSFMANFGNVGLPQFQLSESAQQAGYPKLKIDSVTLGSLPNIHDVGMGGVRGPAACAEGRQEFVQGYGTISVAAGPKSFSFAFPSGVQPTIDNYHDLKVESLNDNGQETTVWLGTIYLEPSACTDSSYVDYLRVFRQGQTIRVNPQDPNEVGFSVSNPVFCHSAPIQKQLVDRNETFQQSNVEFDSLNNGGYVTVPEGQQWLFFYRGRPDISGATECQNNGGVWSVSENKCVLPPTFVYDCHGIEQQTARCVTQPTDVCWDPDTGQGDPEAVGMTLDDGTFVCRKFQTIVTDVNEVININCPLAPDGTQSVLGRLSTGEIYCEWQPIVKCTGGRIENGQCITDAPPVEGPVNGGSLGGSQGLFSNPVPWGFIGFGLLGVIFWSRKR